MRGAASPWPQPLLPLLLAGLLLSATVHAKPLPHSTAPDTCSADMLGNKVCDLACHRASHQWDLDDCKDLGACDAEVGVGYLARMRASSTPICTSASAGPSAGQARMTYAYDTGCEGRELSNLVELHNARVTWDTARQQFDIAVQCTDSGLGRVDSETLGFGGARLSAVPAGDAERDPALLCTGGWVAEPTVLVVNPRDEWLSNAYHATEEYFSLLETANLLDVNVRDLRLAFVKANGPAMLQIESQLAGYTAGPAVTGLFRPRPQILDVYNQLLARGGVDQPTLLPPLPGDGREPLCFRRLVMPIRACHGTVLPRVWSTEPGCSEGNAISRAVSEGVWRAYGLRTGHARAFTGAVQVTLITRAPSGGRPSVNMAAVAAAVRTLPDVFVHEVLLERLTMREQLELMGNTDILAGPHGAGLAMLLYLPPGAAVIEFTDYATPTFGQRSISNIFWKMAEWAQHPFATVHNAGAPDPQEVRRKVEELIAKHKK